MWGRNVLFYLNQWDIVCLCYCSPIYPVFTDRAGKGQDLEDVAFP